MDLNTLIPANSGFGVLESASGINNGGQIAGWGQLPSQPIWHAFLLTPTGGQLYFHRNSMVNRDFDRLEVGAKVHFIETVGDTGPIASKVWRAEGELG